MDNDFTTAQFGPWTYDFAPPTPDASADFDLTITKGTSDADFENFAALDLPLACYDQDFTDRDPQIAENLREYGNPPRGTPLPETPRLTFPKYNLQPHKPYSCNLDEWLSMIGSEAI